MKSNIDMMILDKALTLSEGNPLAFQVLMQLISTEKFNGLQDMMLLDVFQIQGEKIWKLYHDSCQENLNKFNRTMKVFTSSGYTKCEIQDNLNLTNAIPFLDDSIQIPGVPSYEDTSFGPCEVLWNDYVLENRKVVLPKINYYHQQQKMHSL